MLKTPFWFRLLISIILLIVGTVYVLIPEEFQMYLLVIFSILSVTYLIAYGRIFAGVLRYNLTRRSSSKTELTSFNEAVQKIFSEFKDKIEKNIKIVFTNNVHNFESKWVHRTIYINPEYITKIDYREIKPSLFHELGHIKKATNFIFDSIWFSFIPMLYGMFFIIIEVAREGIPIVSTISMFVFIRLIMIVISWRNEYRADKFALAYMEKDELKFMFDVMPFKSDLETHPSPARRWAKINKN